jgi:hypothetical protein
MKLFFVLMMSVDFSFAVGVAVAGADPNAYQTGLALYSKGQYDQAVSQFQQAIQSNPKDWQSYHALGDCYLQEGDKSKALQAYNQSLSINPDTPTAQDMADKIKQANAKAKTVAVSNPSPEGEGSGISFYINTGAALPGSPDVFQEGWGLGEDFGLGVGSRILGNLSALLDLQYQNFPLAPSALIGKGGAIHLFTVMGCLKFRFVPGNATVSPYVVAGLGLAWFTADSGSLSDGFTTLSFPGAQESGDMTFRAGLGADVKLQEKVYCTVEIDGVGVNRDYAGPNPMGFAEGRVGLRFDN